MTTHRFRPALTALLTIAAPRSGRKEPSMRTRLLCALSVMAAVSVVALFGRSPSQASQPPELREAIAFTSTRDHPNGEIYLMNPDGTNTRRLTTNTAGDAFPALSPDGKKIVFDSNRNQGAGEPLNIGDLFVMEHDGTAQTLLTDGSSASWSPDGKHIVFHASKSGTGPPIKVYPGAETSDSDIFVLNVDDCLKLRELTSTVTSEGDCRKITLGHCNMLTDLTKASACKKIVPELAKNITNDGGATIDDDPAWDSGGGRIVFVRHPLETVIPQGKRQFSPEAEIWVMQVNPDGTPIQASDNPKQLTFNSGPDKAQENWVEERGPSWSPDGTRIAYACRKGVEPPPPLGMGNRFDICVINANGTGETFLTSNTVADFTPTWSPDGKQLVYQGDNQLVLVTLNVDAQGNVTAGPPQQLTTSQQGVNVLPSWGMVRSQGLAATQTSAGIQTARPTPTPRSAPTKTPTMTPAATPR